MTLEQLAKQGRRTATFTTAATITSKMSQIRKETIKQALSDFNNVRYRYEYVNTIDGITFYDDAGACSNEATWFSLDNLGMQVIWITSSENIDCMDLIPQVKKYVKDIICIGKNTDKFHSVYANIVSNIIDCENIEDAVKMSARIAVNGDNVIFSPACRPNDGFDNYQKRGDYYKHCVQSLI